MQEQYEKLSEFFSELREFFRQLVRYLVKNLHLSFIKFESGKGIFVSALYKQRGRYAKRLMHSGMAAIAAVGMIIAPIIANEFPGRSVDPWDLPSPSSVLSTATQDPTITTQVSEKVRGEIIKYKVLEGDTVGSIAEKFDISEDAVRWQNGLDEKAKIKVGETLEILPVTGMSHKVSKGDTVYSIAKRYDIDPQPIVNYPFNSFSNDETFELAIGQILIVPDGIKPKARVTPRIRQLTPDAGTVVASGQFAWPSSGKITQRFVWYHKGIDIANKSAPSVLAADSGTVLGAGWLDGYGYGNRIIIDHGNGYKTVYAHLSRAYVVPGQTVRRGDVIGKMGSTGRSTGIHLHFEVIRNGVYLNPLSVLQ